VVDAEATSGREVLLGCVLRYVRKAAFNLGANMSALYSTRIVTVYASLAGRLTLQTS
jgi:hypothetical protein